MHLTLENVVVAVLVACVVGLVCILLGRVLKAVGMPPAVAVGGFFEQYAWAIGLIAGLWAFVTGWRPF